MVGSLRFRQIPCRSILNCLKNYPRPLLSFHISLVEAACDDPRALLFASNLVSIVAAIICSRTRVNLNPQQRYVRTLSPEHRKVDA